MLKFIRELIGIIMMILVICTGVYICKVTLGIEEIYFPMLPVVILAFLVYLYIVTNVKAEPKMDGRRRPYRTRP